jgi:hypothetical protein
MSDMSMSATAAADLERDEQHEEQKPETTSG